MRSDGHDYFTALANIHRERMVFVLRVGGGGWVRDIYGQGPIVTGDIGEALRVDSEARAVEIAQALNRRSPVKVSVEAIDPATPQRQHGAA